MKLQVGKSYLLTTVQSTIIKKKLHVSGLITYEEATKLEYNFRTLAINEKVISNESEDINYFKSRTFYKCYVLNPDNSEEMTSEIVILWDDIIDSNLTTELNIQYNLSLAINIDPNAEIAISEVTKFIIDSILAKYGDKIEADIKIVNTSSNTSIDSASENVLNNAKKTQELLNEAVNTLITLTSMKNSAEKIAKELNDANLSNNLSTMSEKLDTVKTTVDIIYKMVK